MSIDQPALEEVAPVPLPPWWRFSLAELMCGMTLAAVNFYCWKINLLVGCIVSVLWLPATIRTLAEIRVAQRAGDAPALKNQLLFFIHSVLVVLTGFMFSGMIALLVTGLGAVFLEIVIYCFPGLKAQVHNPMMVVLLSSCSVLLLAYIQFRFLKLSWPTGIRYEQRERTATYS